MTSTFEAMLARIDRTSPSLAEALPGIVRLFKMHEDKLAEFDKRIEKTNVDFMKKLDGLADHLDESRHRLHGSINHTDDRATQAMKGVKRAHGRIDFLEDRMTGMEARLPKPAPVEVNVTADTESLTAYVHRLEAYINDIEKGLSNRLDVHRTDIDALERLAGNTNYDHATTEYKLRVLTERLDIQRADIDDLERRISDCELLVGTDKLGPEPPRDRLWHPHDVKKDSRCPVEAGDIVAVLFRGSDTPSKPEIAGRLHWGEMGALTIVGWRYAWGEE